MLFRRDNAEPDTRLRNADLVTVIVRHSPQPVITAARDYEVATVIRFAPGGDGEVPAEEVRDETLRWIVAETDFGSANEISITRRNINIGASGAEVVILLSLLSGVAGGITDKAIDFIVGRFTSRTGDRLEVLDEPTPGALKHAVAHAFDVRAADLSLVERRSSDRHEAAVYEDPSGRFYGVRVEDGGALTIRRLREGDW